MTTQRYRLFWCHLWFDIERGGFSGARKRVYQACNMSSLLSNHHLSGPFRFPLSFTLLHHSLSLTYIFLQPLLFINIRSPNIIPQFPFIPAPHSHTLLPPSPLPQPHLLLLLSTTHVMTYASLMTLTTFLSTDRTTCSTSSPAAHCFGLKTRKALSRLCLCLRRSGVNLQPEISSKRRHSRTPLNMPSIH
jgi:hypothetical protein